jgi:hypothetical protein
MIKKASIALVVTMFMTLVCTHKASAQLVKVSVGVNGGALMTQMATDPAPSNPMYINGYGGAFASIHIGKAITVRGAANYAMQGGFYEVSNVPVTVSQSYLQIPMTLLLNAGRVLSFEVGLVQNILMQSQYKENGTTAYVENPDPGALKYNFGAVGGICINMGKVVFLNVRYCYGLSNSYVMYGQGFPTSTISAGLGFNIYTSKKSAFR